MPIEPEEARQKIAELVDKYKHETNRNQSEADVRANYVDWLFFYLGWNVWHESGQQTTYYREGYVRDAGFVDVGLEIAGQPALLLEAKRFGILPRSKERLGDRSTEEKQAFRYARTRKLPYVILTNFERLQVFNADHERMILWFDEPEEYVRRLPELLHLSPDRVHAGSLPATERQLEIKPIDEQFLALLQDWRLRLANAIYEHNSDNPVLKTDEGFDFGKLMAAVQRILDRLILIRYADDKEVLRQYDILHTIVSYYRKLGPYVASDHLTNEFINLSHMMDEHHNTTLFQRGHICEEVVIPNEVLASIIEEMNDISFRKFTSDILGNTYETYLGTKLVLKNGAIKSEQRRDIRKAVGIYYTPTFIVRYIVDTTLGHLLKELEKEWGPHTIEKAREIKVLDPACGSGSFLIYAYQVFADFYRRMNKDIENEQVKLLASGAGADMFERLELFKHLPKPLDDYPHHILENQLYGVDIDPEAAEIAAVNLTMQAFADSRREKLPLILNENIKVGNSLISGAEEELRDHFGDQWQEQRPFNWEEEFPQIMQGGGFDVVIGNPPWGSFFTNLEKRYLSQRYAGHRGEPDSHLFFIQRGLQLLDKSGVLGFITPNSWLSLLSAKEIRQYLLQRAIFYEICELSKYIFRDAPDIVPIFVFLGKKNGHQTTCIVKRSNVIRVDAENFSNAFVVNEVLQEAWQEMPGSSINLRATSTAMQISERCRAKAAPLSQICDVVYGIKTGDNKNYLSISPSDTHRVKALKTGELLRYHIEWKGLYLWWCAELAGYGQSPLDVRKIIVQYIRKLSLPRRIIAALDTEGIYYPLNNYSYCTSKVQAYSLKYVLGILNSALMNFYFANTFIDYNIKPSYLQQLPIRRIDFDNPEEKKIHDDLVALADRMLELNKHLAPIRNTPCSERDQLQREIERTDHQIDNLVYDLYRLTEEERKIVEKGTNGGHR